MERKTGLLFLVIVSAAWACDARELADNGVLSGQTRRQDSCTLCDQYSAIALDFLRSNITQEVIMDFLHHSCHQLPLFYHQCISLVDYYAPMFFLELDSIQPGEICKELNLCEQIAIISSKMQRDGCGFCREVASELMEKLKDPDTQFHTFPIFPTALMVIVCLNYGRVKMGQPGFLTQTNLEHSTLVAQQSWALYANSSLMLRAQPMVLLEIMEKYLKKGKRLVFEFGPLLLMNAEKFLKTRYMHCNSCVQGTHSRNCLG